MPDSDVQEVLAAVAIMASKSRICYRGVETRTLRRTEHRREFTMSMALRNQRAIFGWENVNSQVNVVTAYCVDVQRSVTVLPKRLCSWTFSDFEQ